MGGSSRIPVARGSLSALALIGVTLVGLAGAQVPDPWRVVSPEEVQGARISLRSSMTTKAPLEWSAFELELEFTGAGAPLIIQYGGLGSGYRLRIEPGVARLDRTGSTRAQTLASADFPREERRFVLRVENGVHELSTPGGGVILEAQGTIARRAPIVFATEPNQVVNFTNVVIRSLQRASLAVTDALPERLVRGERTRVWIRGAGFGPGTVIRPSVPGITAGPQEALTTELLQVELEVRADAPVGPFDLELSERSNGRAVLRGRLVVVSPPPSPPPAPVQGPEVHRLEPDVVVVGERLEARLVGRGLDGASLAPAEPRTGLSVEGARRQPGVFVLGAAPGTRSGRHMLLVTGPGGAIGRVPVEVIAAPAAPLQPLESGTPAEQVALITLGAALASFLGGFKSGFWSGRLARWIDRAQQTWQRAIELELPSIDRPCAWACRPRAEGGVADWEFREVIIEALPEDGRRKDDRRRVLAGDDLTPLQDLGRLKALLTSEADARAALELVGDGFENAVRSWRDEDRSPAAVRVSYVLAKPLTVTLELVHRELGEGGALEWKPRRTWKRKLGAKRGDELVVIRGPGANGDEELKRMRAGFLDALLELAQTVRWTP